MKPTLALLALALIFSGCSSAPKSSEVSAAYIPITQYGNHTCEQLVAEAEAVRRSIPGLEAAVDAHRSNQTGVEVVTWVLFWPAAFALDKGEQSSSQLAKAKGELQAIQVALMTNKCSGGGRTGEATVSRQADGMQPGLNASQASVPASSVIGQSAADKLRALEGLKKDGLITEAEYISKRSQLLEKL